MISIREGENKCKNSYLSGVEAINLLGTALIMTSESLPEDSINFVTCKVEFALPIEDLTWIGQHFNDYIFVLSNHFYN